MSTADGPGSDILALSHCANFLHIAASSDAGCRREARTTRLRNGTPSAMYVGVIQPERYMAEMVYVLSKRYAHEGDELVRVHRTLKGAMDSTAEPQSFTQLNATEWVTGSDDDFVTYAIEAVPVNE